MQHRASQTIKTRISLITVSFSLVLAVFLSTLSFWFFQNYTRRSVVRSTEFNLELIGGMLGQKLNELDMLAKWCVTSAQVADWLTDYSAGTQLSLDVYNRLKEVVWNNRSNGYIRRLIVTDTFSTRLLQVGNGMTESWPVTEYNLPALGLSDYESPSVYRSCTVDPFAIGPQRQVIPVIRPIRRIGTMHRIGYVYLAISVDVLLDSLVNYHMPPDCSLYLRLPRATYRLEGDKFVDITGRIVSTTAKKEDTQSSETVVHEVRLDTGRSSLLVTCPIGIEGAFLAQSLSPRQIAGERMLYMLILALICVAVVLYGAFTSFLLRRIITQPVSRLRSRIDEIAGSNFAVDPGIEWDNEFGDIGRGINAMSEKIVSLLENRLADEKKKRDLEYRMLQSQINPHFLYNTLNSIKWMATIQNATGIAEMTTALSRLMKNVVKGSRTIVSLGEELALLDDYFVIQHYRYGGAVVFEKRIPADLLSLSIPCFILQPLMENAIFHGIEPKGGTGTIVLSARRTADGAVEIEMEDDGVGMTEEQIGTLLSPGEGTPGLFREIGISSVDKRIKYSYGQEYGLRLESVPGEKTAAILRLPFLLTTGLQEQCSS